jgi:chaperone protein htpG
LVYDENDPDFATQQILKQMGQDNLPKILPILEINPNHEIIKKLKDNNMVLNDVAKVLLGVAKIQEGITIENTDEFTSILTSFIQKAI